MKKADIKDFKEIMEIFKKYKEIFPHIRNDYVKRMIENEKCFYEDDIVIIFNTYKRKVKLGNCYAYKGDTILHQIANKNQHNGKAKEKILDFFQFIEGNIFVTIRSSNIISKKFHEKFGFKKIGDIFWKNKEIEGDVYFIDIQSKNEQVKKHKIS
jgi:hypothetical protein